MKIDKRKALYLVLDTETTGNFNRPLIYNIAWQLIDKQGKVYLQENYLINKIFFNEELMKSAYCANKIDYYKFLLKNDQINAVTVDFIRGRLNSIISTYKNQLKAICAYNAKFDKLALESTFNKTLNDNLFFCIWEMFKSLYMDNKRYTRFCNKYHYKTNHLIPKNQTKAETAYKFITNNPDFVEAHTALEDVKIECSILIHLLKQHKKMNKRIKKRLT